MKKLLILNCLCCFWFVAFCQNDSLSLQFHKSAFYLNNTQKKLNETPVRYAFKPKKTVKNFLSDADRNACNTSTFFMRLPANAGNKIDIQNIQTLPEGGFVASANTITASGNEGFLIRMNNDGTITSQKKILIDNKPVTVYKLKVPLSGDIIITGTINNSNDVFVSSVADDFTTKWVKQFSLAEKPLDITLDFYYDDYSESVALAIQLSKSINYFNISTEGVFNWSQKVSVNNLTHLRGFTYMNYNILGLLAERNNNGLQQLEIFEVDIANGNITRSSVLGTNTSNNNFTAITTFNGRLIMLGAVSNNGIYNLQRNITYTADKIETRHDFTLPEAIDFTSSFALDNAGDALGVCIPVKGHLIFLKQFSDYLSDLEFTREYDVPVGSILKSISRSFDGGYIFALDNADSSESIFLKTDSIGTLAGCNYKIIQAKSDISGNISNTSITTKNSVNQINSLEPILSVANIQLTPVFNCRENYCPELPKVDTCLSTYFKVLKSGSYNDGFSYPLLMRNKKIITSGARLDRILGEHNQVTFGLKMIDEEGNFVKGANFFLDGQTSSFDMKQVSDSTILLMGYSTQNNLPCYTFALVNDAFKVLWVHTLITPDVNLGSQNIVIDEDGFYFISAGYDFNNLTSNVTVFKFNTSGNVIWAKGYDFGNAEIGLVEGVTTKTSLIIVGEGWYYGKGSLSMRIDKNSGAVANGYLFDNYFSQSLYERFLKVDNNKIFYTSSNLKNDLVVGMFDTTGLPVKLKLIKNYSLARATTYGNNTLYMSTGHYANGSYKDEFIAFDSSLNFSYMHEYNISPSGDVGGMAVSKEGNIYATGYTNDSYWYSDPFIKKFNSNGELGTCSYKLVTPPIVDADPKPFSIPITLSKRSFESAQVPVELVEEDRGQHISAILCSSSPTCTDIKLFGAHSVCKINADYTYQVKRNTGCTLQPAFSFDTSFASIHKVTDSTVAFSFKKTGNTYIIAAINAGCSVYKDSFQVQIQKSTAGFSLGNDTVLCSGNKIDLNAGEGYNSYLWQDGSTSPGYIVNAGGTYYVKVDNACGDFFTDTIHISTAITPAFFIGNDTSVCNGDAIQLNAPVGFKQYNWFPSAVINNNSSASAIINQDVLIYTDAISNDGCKVSDSINIYVLNAQPVNLGNDTSFCSYDSVMLNAGNNYQEYTWNTGSTSSSIIVNKTGLYSVKAKDNNGCFAMDTMQVTTVFAQPIPNLGNDKSICAGSEIQLDAGKYAAYLWQDDSYTEFYNLSEPGKYWVTVTDNNKCKGSDTINIAELITPPLNFLKTSDSLCDYDQMILQPTGNYALYKWSTGEMQPSITINNAGLYFLTVTDFNGCVGTDTTTILQKQCMNGVYIPTAFTPNGDGKNDIFKAKVFGKIISFRFNIYNRFGELVFSTADPSKGWNGTIQQQPQNIGVYIWQCTYQLEGSNATNKKGTVLLMH